MELEENGLIDGLSIGDTIREKEMGFWDIIRTIFEAGTETLREGEKRSTGSYESAKSMSDEEIISHIQHDSNMFDKAGMMKEYRERHPKDNNQ